MHSIAQRSECWGFVVSSLLISVSRVLRAIIGLGLELRRLRGALEWWSGRRLAGLQRANGAPEGR